MGLRDQNQPGVLEYQRKQECYSHDTLDEIIPLDAGHDSITAGELLSQARRLAGPDAELELGRDVLEKLVCPQCGQEEPMFASLGQVREDATWCPDCDRVRREVVTFYKIRGQEPFRDRTLEQIGVPAYDVVVARAGDRSIGLELAGDAAAVLGPLVGGEDELEWA